MTIRNLSAPLFLAAALGVLGPASAEADFVSLGEKRVELDAAAVDVVFSQDGRWIFVLTEGGVEVLNSEGVLVQKLAVKGKYDRMALSPAGDRLVLTTRSGGEMKILQLEQVFTVDDRNSPSRGPDTAPVVIAVYSDFQ